jgi:hypothetical protein
VRVGVLFRIEDLRSILEEYGTRHFFRVCRGGPKFYCHRGYQSESEANRDRCKVPGKRQRDRKKTMKCDCLWSVTFSEKEDKIVEITNVSDKHTNHIPDPKEMVACVTSSTKPKPIDVNVWAQLVNLRRQLNNRVPTKTIRALIQPFLPSSVYISSDAILYIRKQIENLCSKPSTEIEDFIAKLQPTQWLSELNTALKDNLSPVIQQLDEIVLLLEDVTVTDTFKLKELFKIIRRKDKTFAYSMATNNQNVFTGCCWATASMRSHFENFGTYICCDACMRETNDHLWVYLAITIKNELGESHPVTECLALGERKDVYAYMFENLFRFCPNMSPSDVMYVSSDGFLDSDFIQNFFPKAKFIADRYHLLLAIKERVGMSLWNKYSDSTKHMIHAKDEQSFDFYLNDLIQNATIDKDEKLANYFRILGEKREYYADYYLQTYEGTLGMVGSVIAEQNNSSILAFIDDLNSSRSLDALVIKLLQRQRLKEKKTNRTLLTNHLILKKEATMKHAPEWKISAAEHLCLGAYQNLCTKVEQVYLYTVETMQSVDSGIITYKVKRDDGSPRVFHSPHDRCNCVDRIAHMWPCVHEIALRMNLNRGDPFDIAMFHRRYYLRSALTLSKEVPLVGLDEEDVYVDMLKSAGLLEDEDNAIGLHDPEDDDSVVELETKRHGGDDEVHKSCTETVVETSKGSMVKKQDKNVTYSMIMEAAKETANELNNWSNDTRVVFLGLLGKSLEMLRSKGKATANFYVHEMSKYVTSWLEGCKAEFRPMPKKSNTKRLKGLAEMVNEKKRKEDSTTQLSQPASKKPKSCSYCGEAMSTGGHCATNCPVRRLEEEELKRKATK